MKEGFRKAFIVFKWLCIVYAIVYWPGVVIDDWGLVEKYWSAHWLNYITLWLFWFCAYLIAFTIYYWIAATIVVTVYYKLILPLFPKKDGGAE